MKQRQLCDPEDMVLFLLALCRQSDSSDTSVSRSEDLEQCFDDCLKVAVNVANSPAMKERLDA